MAERAGDGVHKGVPAEGLGHIALGPGWLGPAADEQDGEFGPEGARVLDEFEPVHAGHVDVGDEEVDGAVMDETIERGDAVRGLVHGVAGAFQHPGGGFTHHVVVIDEQDGDDLVG